MTLERCPGVRPSSGAATLECSAGLVFDVWLALDIAAPGTGALRSSAAPAFSISTSATGVPGQIWTVPVLWTCAPTHCMNWPIERIMPSCLCKNDGVHGRFSACCSNGSANLKVRMSESAICNTPERRLAPCGSSRYKTFSSPTGAAIGMPAVLISGKLARNARALVTTPDTPKPMSSARS